MTYRIFRTSGSRAPQAPNLAELEVVKRNQDSEKGYGDSARHFPRATALLLNLTKSAIYRHSC
jgi:hypothetical protein